ncbi:MAG TPA: hypothetical protein DHW02_07385 [Ktedonobacter sp.]|nr:hypothetical protein [Ktedonobacter sp.]
MAQRNSRLIGGVYRTGQVMSTEGPLTTCTAYNHNTDDVVGLFILEAPPTFSPQTIQQLLQPLEQRRRLQSPHVIRVYDLGVDGSRAYIVTDPPRGVTLRHVLDNENIDLTRALDLSQQLAIGLKALHEHSIAGLDLRPLLITIDTTGIQDRVQIDDVGLRLLLSAFGSANAQHNDAISNLDPRYAPPEYIQSGHIGPWSDIYQVGLLLFEMITGRLPFVGRNNAETGILQTTQPVPNINQYKHDAPPALQSMVDRMLAKDPAARFSSVDALLTVLESIQPRASAPLVLSNTAQLNMTKEMHATEERTLRVARPSHSAESIQPIQGIPTERGIYAYLVVEQGNGEARQIPLLQKEVVIGRLDPKRGVSPDIDLSAYDPRMTVSRQHARIRFADNFFYLEDLKSHNKTRLNEIVLKSLQSEKLQDGDEVRFGSVVATFKIPDSSEQVTINKEP